MYYRAEWNSSAAHFKCETNGNVWRGRGGAHARAEIMLCKWKEIVPGAQIQRRRTHKPHICERHRAQARALQRCTVKIRQVNIRPRRHSENGGSRYRHQKKCLANKEQIVGASVYVAFCTWIGWEIFSADRMWKTGLVNFSTWRCICRILNKTHENWFEVDKRRSATSDKAILDEVV